MFGSAAGLAEGKTAAVSSALASNSDEVKARRGGLC